MRVPLRRLVERIASSATKVSVGPERPECGLRRGRDGGRAAELDRPRRPPQPGPAAHGQRRRHDVRAARPRGARAVPRRGPRQRPRMAVEPPVPARVDAREHAPHAGAGLRRDGGRRARALRRDRARRRGPLGARARPALARGRLRVRLRARDRAAGARRRRAGRPGPASRWSSTITAGSSCPSRGRSSSASSSRCRRRRRRVRRTTGCRRSPTGLPFAEHARWLTGGELERALGPALDRFAYLAEATPRPPSAAAAATVGMPGHAVIALLDDQHRFRGVVIERGRALEALAAQAQAQAPSRGATGLTGSTVGLDVTADSDS